MFLTGKPLRSAYRVIARDGRVVWFHCEAKMILRSDGDPWFIPGEQGQLGVQPTVFGCDTADRELSVLVSRSC
jgi:hypothetical protein